MLHKRKVARALWGNGLRQIGRWLGRPRRSAVWDEAWQGAALRRHTELVKLFLQHWPADWELTGKTICEVGCSDCFALASLLIGQGAAQVALVEPSAPALDRRQVSILESIRQSGFPLDPSILQGSAEIRLDDRRVAYHRSLMEVLPVENAYDYLFSISVLEHVEDLAGFQRACARALKPRGRMFHLVDLSGHGELEDPVPPLDFQTYPDWLYDLMFPPFHRATRLFLSEYLEGIRRAGMVLDETKVSRRADPAYLQAVWPRLRREAQASPPEEVGILEAVLLSHKP